MIRIVLFKMPSSAVELPSLGCFLDGRDFKS